MLSPFFCGNFFVAIGEAYLKVGPDMQSTQVKYLFTEFSKCYVHVYLRRTSHILLGAV